MRRLSPFLFAVAFFAVFGCRQKPIPRDDTNPDSFLLHALKAEDVVVRFYYEPMVNEPTNISPGPLILMPVSSQDPRLGTKPAWIVFVTLTDLRRVLQVLAQAPLSWKESPSPRQLVVEPFALPNPHHDSMEVAVTTSNESATAELKASRVCNMLADLSNAITNMKARDGITFYRRTVSCLPPENRSNPGSSPD